MKYRPLRHHSGKYLSKEYSLDLFTMDELSSKLSGNEDMRKADKKYTQFNIPTAHAHVTKTPSLGSTMGISHTGWRSIHEKNLLPRCYRCTFCGPVLNMQLVDRTWKSPIWVYPREADNGLINGILTSVRYGTGANEATDEGTAETVPKGWQLLFLTTRNLKLNEWDKLQVNMGAAHKNQYYCPAWRPKMVGFPAI